MQLRRLVLVFFMVICFGMSIPTASSQAAPSVKMLLETLNKQTTKPPTIAYHAETGKVRFIGTAPEHPVTLAQRFAANADPNQVARAFLRNYGSLFGLRDPSHELTLMELQTLEGRSFVRYQQQYQGIPVLAGELIVQVGRGNTIVSASGEVLPNLSLDTTPRITAEQALQSALTTIERTYGVASSEVSATTPELWIFNPALLGGPGLRRDTLVWRMELRGESDIAVFRELVLVDAQLGHVALHFNQIAHALDRRVCDHRNRLDPNDDPNDDCASDAQAVRREGQGPTGDSDIDRAYDYSGDIYNYFYNSFGRDSIDNKGMKLISLVKYCPNDASSCPYENAFWNGVQMTYGQNYASADDVVGHELTHGVVEHTAHLFYYYQSGAINESLADVFGELMDLSNGKGNDAADKRWLLGEDLPIGAIRDMKNPPAFGDPDRMNSPNYTDDIQGFDSGGVHQNSGVNNKAAFLMTDGGTFNGQTITGLGPAKVGQIYYRVLSTMLTSGSDYQDLGTALPAACESLIHQHGITQADCDEVRKVVTATEMLLQPSAAPAPHAEVCGVDKPVTRIFFDDFERPELNNWQSTAHKGLNYWFYPAIENPYDFDATYATSGKGNLWGDDLGGTFFDPTPPSDYSIAMARSVTLPPNAFLHFNHAFGFDYSPIFESNYDGGVLEYSTDNGATWKDAQPLVETNGYNGTLDTSTDNPLAGRMAFVQNSNGYIQSRYDLSSLAGQPFRIRFRIGVDSAVGYYGWFIDDLQIATCDVTEWPNKNWLPVTLGYTG
jgi:bacillolysin